MTYGTHYPVAARHYVDTRRAAWSVDDAPAPTKELLSIGTASFARPSQTSYHAAPPNTTGGFLAWAPPNVPARDARDGNQRMWVCEGARTNLVTWHQDLGLAPWTPIGGASVVKVAAQTPDGQPLVDFVSFPGVSPNEGFDFPIPAWTSGSGCFSYWARAPVTRQMRYSIYRRNGSEVIGNATIGPTWVRHHVSVQYVGGPFPCGVRLLNHDIFTSAVPIFVWGVQFEAGPANQNIGPTSNIQTFGSTATRQAATCVVTRYGSRLRRNFEILASPNWIYNDTQANVISAMLGFEPGGTIYVHGPRAGRFYAGPIAYQRGVLAQFDHNQSINYRFDNFRAQVTVTGATVGDGTGPVGTQPSVPPGYCSFGHSGTVTPRFFNGRLRVPWAARPPPG